MLRSKQDLGIVRLLNNTCNSFYTTNSLCTLSLPLLLSAENLHHSLGVIPSGCKRRASYASHPLRSPLPGFLQRGSPAETTPSYQGCKKAEPPCPSTDTMSLHQPPAIKNKQQGKYSGSFECSSTVLMIKYSKPENTWQLTESLLMVQQPITSALLDDR